MSFDGPIELKEMKTSTKAGGKGPLSPYASTRFHPYDPIITDAVELKWVRKVLFITIVASTFALVQLIRHYETLIDQYNPQLITVVTGSLSCVLAQLINQFYKRFFSISSLLKFFVWGCLNGIMTSLWINVLIENVPNILLRVCVDQFIGSPSFQLVFFAISSLWDNHDLRQNLRLHYVKSLKLSYLIWPSFSLLSFSILPSELIYPCNCVVNLIWNVVLSFTT